MEKPTNINNVKTISYVPQIIKNGSEWFKSTGTEKSSGTAIVCLSGHINRPGMYEVPMGMTIEEVLDQVGGGSNSTKNIKMHLFIWPDVSYPPTYLLSNQLNMGIFTLMRTLFLVSKKQFQKMHLKDL